MRRIPFLAALLVAVPLLTGTAARAEDKLTIVAAENFYGDLARQIGGSNVTVTSILANPDDDPHLFETSPSTARTIADAKIVIYNGADYDPWMDKLLSASTAKDRTTIVAADLIGKKSGDNPHLWYDPATLPAIAKALSADLAKRDPANAVYYEANLKAFQTSLEAIDKEITDVKNTYAGTEVTATEPVFGYMAEALGLKMLNYDFQVALMNDAEPSATQVAAFENSLKDGSAKILFYNSQVTDEATTRLLDIAKQNKVTVIGVTETEPAGQTIQTWFGGQIDAVQKALAARTQ
ncbi:zinc ABC transporter substrate-binding protein [Mesorhizobium sp. M1060]|uniref:metal ABC transporter solute-binding protein, Zn/Mn family n=1 Tax=unclassified Mesorhizobium TaxID=325217 RepID=UPI0003CE5260|nr:MULTISPECIES: zinc ABC transporter substrate-binding protein [unclassified Mesorhizobium]ESX24203.1 cation ABC transporter substrate-binding protein [Mesorhizobium sp. LSHC440B00]ESX31158.1 cation ABC transporter substrate-binding protein [Mesorhizobium sp. LSHC432A00]ESX68447.1 cation ABC transporter substrate-binding protein [Mesorhizobium sp. LSHC414A00]WJI51552.1 zinc ABC transporter substrate-binding protein [Mesorhizobium sp. C089B]WJI56444.1 zinc ABC transporter substrate-binding pro